MPTELVVLNRIAAAAAAVLAAGSVLASAPAAGPSAKPAAAVRGRFRVPFYDSRNPQRLLSELAGEGAKLEPNGRIRLQSARVFTFDAQGRTNLIVYATNCVFDPARRAAESAEPLRVESGDGRLTLEGRGFLWRQTNNALVISNEVRTLLRRPPPEGPLRIQSRRFEARLDRNEVEYSGEVLAWDKRRTVRCGRLRAARNERGDFERIAAEEAVRVQDAEVGGEVRAERALYLAGETRRIEFAGGAHWADGAREAAADRFLILPEKRELLATGAARIRFPAAPDSLQPGPLPGAPSQETASSAVEAAAEWIRALLPLTNGPVRAFQARTNVTIRLPRRGIRAVARAADYTPEQGLSLRGAPEWQGPGWRLRAETFHLDPQGQSFVAEGPVFLRVDGSVWALPPKEEGKPAVGKKKSPPQWLETRSRRLSYAANVMRFEGPARARYLIAGRVRTVLEADSLFVRYEGRLRSLRAEGNVRIQDEAGASANAGSRELTCGRAEAFFDKTGGLERIVARDRVRARQEEPQSGGGWVTTWFLGERLEARFAPKTRALKEAIGSGGTQVMRGEILALAERVAYDAAAGRFVLDGEPWVWFPDGRLAGARRLIWERDTGRVQGEGRFRLAWRGRSLTNLTVQMPWARGKE